MGKNRLEAFSDGVLAILITIMVLELKAPKGAALEELRSLLPVFLSYVLSFAYLGVYWNNHHHLLHATKQISAGILWANLYLLFWLSLLPFATAWMGTSWDNSSPAPTAVYGFVLLMSAIAYYILQQRILAGHGPESPFAAEFGRDWKGKLSPLLYVAAIPLALVHPWISNAIYAAVALIWIVPDRRIERALQPGNVRK